MERALTQMEVAKAMGCTNVYLCDIERGRRGPPRSLRLLLLAQLLDVPVVDILKQAGMATAGYGQASKKHVRELNGVLRESGVFAFVHERVARILETLELVVPKAREFAPHLADRLNEAIGIAEDLVCAMDLDTRAGNFETAISRIKAKAESRRRHVVEVA